jgi:hypothetical protein
MKRRQEVKISRIALLIGSVVTSVLFLEVAVHADDMGQATKLTFSKPIEIPGQVLPAGTYLFKLADSNNLDLIRIFNADGTHLFATLETIPTERRESTRDTEVTLAEQPNGEPAALVKWFYLGRTTGHEFVYSKQEEQEIAQDRQQTVVVKQTAEAGD